ncbi:zinc finger, CCHC-type containing protein [Tanacetum coccineum]
MDAAAMKHMTSNFAKLDKFEGVDFIRWQKKMHFLLSTMSVVYVLTTHIPEDGGDDATVKQIRKRNKWDNDDYVCRELWNSLEAKYMAEDASSKKFLVSNFTNYKITISRPVMEQYNKLLGILDFKHTLKNKKEELTLVELGSHLRIEESLRAHDSDKPKGNNVAGPHMLDWAISTKRKQDMSKDGLILAFDMDTENDLCDLHATLSLGNKKHFVTFIDDASRAVVRLPDPKLKTFSERGIEGIFVGYAEHSKAFRFYVIEPNDSVLINSIIESRDAIFDENKFSSVPRPSQKSLVNGTEYIGCSVVPKEVTKEIVRQLEPELRKNKRNRTPKDFGPEFQLYLIEGTRDEVSDQHSYCFNVEDDPKTFDEAMKKLKLDRTIEKFKARLVIQGFKQKSGIYYFDTYAPVVRISTIRLLIAMASIHNLIIHQMDVKIAFLNGDLDEEAPKQWHQKFDEVVLSNGYLLNQADKCVYSKFDESGKGVIICLYVDDMLIFGTDQVQVDLTKEFLSSKFSMKDMGEADVILGIRIKHKSNGIAISQSHYIEKVLKKFNYFDCTRVSTPIDTSEKLMPNNGQVVSQLEYSRVIGCLMYVMTCTRPDIAFDISNTEDNSSTSGWVFLLGGGAVSGASKKQTCIISSTMGSEFMALAAASKEAEWLKNLLFEIPLWSKPIAPISIRCDSAATLAKAYSQMYNGKSRHLGVGHSMIRELITNGVISIEFVRSQQNLADHLTKELARHLVIKSVEGIGLKSN